MQHFLRRLTAISAMALVGVISGGAQTSQPATGGTAAPAEKKKQYKDQQEYTLYDSATKETDANKKLATLKTWQEKYPDSDYKTERLQLLLSTYQQLGQPKVAAVVVDAAKAVLATDPRDLTALYSITSIAPNLGSTSPDTLDTAEKASNGLLAAEKPAAVKDEDWAKAKPQTDAIAYATLGWIAMQRKNNEVAEQNFKKSLAINPNAGQLSYWLGTVILAEKKPEKQAEALFDFARAAAYDGPGALTPEGRQQIDAYLTKVYNTFHGDSSGLAELKAVAKASPTPPPNFTIKTKAEIDAAREEAEAKANPQLALWKRIKESLLAQDGEEYFKSVKGAGLPGGVNGVTKFRGWLVKADPPVKSNKLLVSMEGKDQPADVTLKLVGADGTTAAPLTGKPVVGVEIEFEGIGDSFTKDPAFMLTFDIEKGKVCTVTPEGCTGLKEEKVQPAHRPPAHKKK